jgi:hypothetical protein
VVAVRIGRHLRRQHAAKHGERLLHVAALHAALQAANKDREGAGR